ncbi:hypothetical protein Trydic_g18617, partial [Trypoxylus dichotomus]
ISLKHSWYFKYSNDSLLILKHFTNRNTFSQLVRSSGESSGHAQYLHLHNSLERSLDESGEDENKAWEAFPLGDLSNGESVLRKLEYFCGTGLLLDYHGHSRDTLQKWNSGRTEQWKNGTIEHWNRVIVESGRMEQCKNGAMEQWNNETIEQWSSGTVKQWNSGAVEQWNGGTMGKTNNGTVTQWNN